MTIPAPPTSGVPLDRPLYGASLGQAVVRFFKKYATFSGRASRSEYWWIALITAVVVVITSIISTLVADGDLVAANTASGDPGDILYYVWTVATLVPSLAVAVRRLHDIDKSGWWMLIGFVPLVGWIFLIVWYASRSKPAGSRFDR